MTSTGAVLALAIPSGPTGRSTAVLSDGSYVVAWQSYGEEGDGYGIYGQRYSANGAKAGSEFRINAVTTGDQLYPSVTALAGGGFVVAWQGSSANPGVCMQRFDVAGHALGGEMRANSYTGATPLSPTLATLTDGGWVVAWTITGEDGSGYGVYAQRYTVDGAAFGGEFRVNTTVTGDQTGSLKHGGTDDRP